MSSKSDSAELQPKEGRKVPCPQQCLLHVFCDDQDAKCRTNICQRARHKAQYMFQDVLRRSGVYGCSRRPIFTPARNYYLVT